MGMSVEVTAVWGVLFPNPYRPNPSPQPLTFTLGGHEYPLDEYSRLKGYTGEPPVLHDLSYTTVFGVLLLKAQQSETETHEVAADQLAQAQAEYAALASRFNVPGDPRLYLTVDFS